MRSQRRGFTLVELLVVIAIIGLLASIVLASLGGARGSAKDARRISQIRQIQYALELYYTNHGMYPCALYGSSGCQLNGNTEMVSVPTDPSGAQFSYAAYGAGASCSSYHLGTSLEKNNNAALKTDRDLPVTAGLCTNSPADFDGLSAASGGQPCSTTAGTAQPGGTETCYDVVP
jgi:prepilin-type N-terminal cleavage/methylation domain-containing protein